MGFSLAAREPHCKSSKFELEGYWLRYKKTGAKMKDVAFDLRCSSVPHSQQGSIQTNLFELSPLVVSSLESSILILFNMFTGITRVISSLVITV